MMGHRPDSGDSPEIGSETPISLAHLRVFAAVAAHGSFTLAAEALGMTQSGASQAVAALETRLGASCFERDRSGIALTGVGARILPHVRAVLEGASGIRSAVADALGTATGRLRLAAPPCVLTRLLPDLLANLHSRYPGVEVAVLPGHEREIRQWVEAGAVEVGLVGLPVPRLKAVSCGQDEWRLVVASGHSLAARATARVSDLGREPLLLCPGGCSNGVLETARAAGVDIRRGLEAQELQVRLDFVREGLGITVLPSLSLPDGLDGLCALAFVPAITRAFGLVTKAGARLSPAVAAMLEATAARAPLQPRSGSGRSTRGDPRPRRCEPRTRRRSTPKRHVHPLAALAESE